MLKQVQEQFHMITEMLIRDHFLISTMESCTAGMIASLLTDTEGSSEVFRGSLVTYSNEAKEDLGVSTQVISTYGVYSHETADAMASACRSRFDTDIGIGITGTFGNVDPNNGDSIPGIVYLSVSAFQEMYRYRLILKEEKSRFEYKLATAHKLADKLLTILKAYEDHYS